MALSSLLQPRINELGKVKIGGLGAEKQSRSGGTYRVPAKFDHFLITTMNRGPKGDLIPDTALMNSLKEFNDHDGKLRQLPIYVLSNEPEDIMQSAFVWYEGKKLAARSDGEMLTIFYDAHKNEWLANPRETEWNPAWRDLKDKKGNRRFKLHTTLNVVIAATEARYGGFYKFRTTSEISANQLYGSLIHLRELTGGILRGLPLRMIVRPIQVCPNGVTSTVQVVHLEMRGPDLMSIQKLALERAQFEVSNRRQLEVARLEYKKMLFPPGVGESTDDQAAIADEFQPEEGAEGTQGADEQTPQSDPLASALGLGDKAPEPAKEPPVEQQPHNDSSDAEYDDGDPNDPNDPVNGSLFKGNGDEKAQHDATK